LRGAAGTLFTCFTGTKVQILTLRAASICFYVCVIVCVCCMCVCVCVCVCTYIYICRGAVRDDVRVEIGSRFFKYATIASDQPDSGSYYWKVPNNMPPGWYIYTNTHTHTQRENTYIVITCTYVYTHTHTNTHTHTHTHTHTIYDTVQHAGTTCRYRRQKAGSRYKAPGLKSSLKSLKPPSPLPLHCHLLQ
jgi:hypothetical protein